jgi:hypothetical protein
LFGASLEKSRGLQKTYGLGEGISKWSGVNTAGRGQEATDANAPGQKKSLSSGEGASSFVQLRTPVFESGGNPQKKISRKTSVPTMMLQNRKRRRGKAEDEGLLFDRRRRLQEEQQTGREERERQKEETKQQRSSRRRSNTRSIEAVEKRKGKQSAKISLKQKRNKNIFKKITNKVGLTGKPANEKIKDLKIQQMEWSFQYGAAQPDYQVILAVELSSSAFFSFFLRNLSLNSWVWYLSI